MLAGDDSGVKFLRSACPGADTTNEMTVRAPAMVHIFFSIALRRSSTNLMSLSHPFLITSVSLVRSVEILSNFSNKTLSTWSCLSSFYYVQRGVDPSSRNFPGECQLPFLVFPR